MNKAGEILSKEKRINKIFAKIAGIPDPKTRIAIPGTGIADPGDLLFFITHHYDKESFYKNKPGALKKFIKRPIEPFFRRCYGFAKKDYDVWHVAIYFMGRKRKRHQRINLWKFHSHPSTPIEKGGVHIQHLSPTTLIRGSTKPMKRVEILQYKGITRKQRKQITDFALSNVGSKFDNFILWKAKLTLVFGLPNFLHDQSLYACQSLVVCAYHAAGIHFPHPSNSFPLCNIGRYLGRPLGHPKDRVNPRYPYLMDHHIYRDPRFKVKAAVTMDPKTKDLKLKTGNIEKYSWSKKLRNQYMAENRC